MKRMKFLFGQRRMQVLLTLAVLLLAVSVVIGSGANFTSQSANPSNTFTAGNLTHLNSKTGAAILTATLMKPSDVRNGTVDITNNGDIPGTFTLTNSNVVDLPLPALSTLLTVKIFETKVLPIPGAETQIYGGAGGVLIGTNPNLTLTGAFAVGEKRSYRFEVTFPNGTPAHDNPYKLSSMTMEYDWTATS
jgi:spore coat-associated protein N